MQRNHFSLLCTAYSNTNIFKLTFFNYSFLHSTTNTYISTYERMCNLTQTLFLKYCDIGVFEIIRYRIKNKNSTSSLRVIADQLSDILYVHYYMGYVWVLIRVRYWFKFGWLGLELGLGLGLGFDKGLALI